MGCSRRHRWGWHLGRSHLSAQANCQKTILYFIYVNILARTSRDATNISIGYKGSERVLLIAIFAPLLLLTPTPAPTPPSPPVSPPRSKLPADAIDDRESWLKCGGNSDREMGFGTEKFSYFFLKSLFGGGEPSVNAKPSLISLW